MERFFDMIDLLRSICIRGSDIMHYPVWLRRLVLITLPVSVPLIVALVTFGSLIVFLPALLMSIVEEVQIEGVGYLFHAPSLRDLYVDTPRR